MKIIPPPHCPFCCVFITSRKSSIVRKVCPLRVFHVVPMYHSASEPEANHDDVFSNAHSNWVSITFRTIFAYHS